MSDNTNIESYSDELDSLIIIEKYKSIVKDRCHKYKYEILCEDILGALRKELNDIYKDHLDNRYIVDHIEDIISKYIKYMNNVDVQQGYAIRTPVPEYTFDKGKRGVAGSMIFAMFNNKNTANIIKELSNSGGPVYHDDAIMERAVLYNDDIDNSSNYEPIVIPEDAEIHYSYLGTIESITPFNDNNNEEE